MRPVAGVSRASGDRRAWAWRAACLGLLATLLTQSACAGEAREDIGTDGPDSLASVPADSAGAVARGGATLEDTGGAGGSQSARDSACTSPGVAEAVERFGERLRQVSLLAPDSLREREMREAYAGLVTPELLGRWLENPAEAPGRDVSSPWPERIEISSVAPGDGECRIEGEVIYVASAGGEDGNVARRQPVTLRLGQRGGWRISAFETLDAP